MGFGHPKRVSIFFEKKVFSRNPVFGGPYSSYSSGFPNWPTSQLSTAALALSFPEIFVVGHNLGLEEELGQKSSRKFCTGWEHGHFGERWPEKRLLKMVARDGGGGGRGVCPFSLGLYYSKLRYNP